MAFVVASLGGTVACSFDWGPSAGAEAGADAASTSAPDATSGPDAPQPLACAAAFSVDECSASTQCPSDKGCCTVCSALTRKCSPVGGCVNAGGLVACATPSECTERGFTACSAGVCVK